MRNTFAEILDGARTIFRERSFHGGSIMSICWKAEVTAPLLYQYVGSKAGLYNRLYQHDRAVLNEFLGDALARDVTPREQFRQLWAAMVRFVSMHQEELAFLERHWHWPHLDEDNRAIPCVPEAVTVGVQYVLRGLGRPEKDAPLLAMVIWGAFVQVVKGRWNEQQRIDGTVLDVVETACWILLVSPPHPDAPEPGRNVELVAEIFRSAKWFEERSTPEQGMDEAGPDE